jgi:hypothetical protein
VDKLKTEVQEEYTDLPHILLHSNTGNATDLHKKRNNGRRRRGEDAGEENNH